MALSLFGDRQRGPAPEEEKHQQQSPHKMHRMLPRCCGCSFSSIDAALALGQSALCLLSLTTPRYQATVNSARSTNSRHCSFCRSSGIGKNLFSNEFVNHLDCFTLATTGLPGNRMHMVAQSPSPDCPGFGHHHVRQIGRIWHLPQF